MEDLLAAILRGDATEWPFSGAEAEQRYLEVAFHHRLGPLVARQLRRAQVLAQMDRPI